MSVPLFTPEGRLSGEHLDERDAGQYIAVLQRRVADLEGEFRRRGINPDEWRRADQNCVCGCGKIYLEHPYGGEVVYDRTLILSK